MSVEQIALAWASGVPPIDRLVLLALADWADKAGRCWPSVPQLAEKTGVHERTVRLALIRLEAGGKLERQSVIGKGTRYRLTIAATPGATPTPGAAPTPGVAPGTPGAAPTNTLATRQKRKKASPSPSTRRSDYPMPDGVDPQAWADFLANRKRKRLANTASAHTHLIEELTKHATPDWPWPRLIALAAGKGWASVRNPDRQDGARSGWAPRPGMEGVEPAFLDDEPWRNP